MHSILSYRYTKIYCIVDYIYIVYNICHFKKCYNEYPCLYISLHVPHVYMQKKFPEVKSLDQRVQKAILSAFITRTLKHMKFQFSSSLMRLLVRSARKLIKNTDAQATCLDQLNQNRWSLSSVFFKAFQEIPIQIQDKNHYSS